MSAEVRELIRERFLAQYARHGMQGMTVKSLCRAVPIARTTFYAYYDDLYSVLEEIEDEIIGTLFRFNEGFKDYDLGPFQRGEPVTCFDETLSYIRAHRLWFQALMGERAERSFVLKWKKIIKDHFREKYARELPGYPHLELVLEQVAAAAIGAYDYWVRHEDEEISVQEMARLCGTRICFDFIDKKACLK